MTKEMVREIMMSYLDEKKVDEMMDDVLAFLEDPNEDASDVDEVLDEYGTDLYYGEEKALVNQLCGKLPSERSVVQKAKNTVKVNVTSDDIAVYLQLQPEYREGTQFIEFLRVAIAKNIGAFEVPVGYPTFDEFGRIIFVSEYQPEHFWSGGLGNLAKRNNLLFGDVDHFVLYLASVMNDIVKDGEDPIDVFYAFTATDDDVREGPADSDAVTRIQEKYSWLPWGDYNSQIGVRTDTSVAMISLSWCYDVDESCQEEYLDWPFFIIEN